MNKKKVEFIPKAATSTSGLMRGWGDCLGSTVRSPVTSPWLIGSTEIFGVEGLGGGAMGFPDGTIGFGGSAIGLEGGAVVSEVGALDCPSVEVCSVGSAIEFPTGAIGPDEGVLLFEVRSLEPSDGTLVFVPNVSGALISDVASLPFDCEP